MRINSKYMVSGVEDDLSPDAYVWVTQMTSKSIVIVNDATILVCLECELFLFLSENKQTVRVGVLLPLKSVSTKIG